MTRQCPSCGRLVALTVRGTFRDHKTKARESCPMGETPSGGVNAPDSPSEDGVYWTRDADGGPWLIAQWTTFVSGGTWIVMGNEQEYPPSPHFVDWRGPLKPPPR